MSTGATRSGKNQTLPPIEIINWPNIKVTDWIMEITNKGKIGFDPWLHSVDEIEQYRKSTENTNIVLQPTENLIDIIWTISQPRQMQKPFDTKTNLQVRHKSIKEKY